MNNLEIANKVIDSVGDLPAMPETVSEVLSMTDDPEVAMADVSLVIQKDPSLTAKILRVSNSPFYGMKQYVGTPKLALVILGVREVRNIVLGISVFESLGNAKTKVLFGKGFWEHSIKVAALSKKLGLYLKLGLQGEDFIAGLLHDIGKMILWRQMGNEYRQVYNSAGGHGDSLRIAEFEKYGFDHSDAAMALTARWNLPMTLSEALYYHHNREDKHIKDAKDSKLAAIVRISDLAIYDDFESDPAEIASCNDDDAWNELNSAANVIEPELRAERLAEFVSELNDMPPQLF